MRKLLTLLFVAISAATFAQAPQGINYQAVIRDNGGAVLANQAVGMKVAILQGSPSGTAVYEESFSPTTSQFGLVNVVIGQGTIISGDFTTIDWSAGPYYAEVSADETGGTSYSVLGTQQLMSVPYSLYAETAENVTNDQVDDADADPNNEIQSLTYSNDTLFISGSNGVFFPSSNNYSIGDTIYGGIIFYVDETGEHGLIYKPYSSLPLLSANFDAPAGTPSTYGNYVGGGFSNALLRNEFFTFTNDMSGITNPSNSNTTVASDLKRYGEYYIPCITELEILYSEKSNLGITTTNPIVSSNIYYGASALYQGRYYVDFSNGNVFKNTSNAFPCSYVYVRKF